MTGRKVHSSAKYITNVEEMKNLHNEYNNMYYWSNDFVSQQKQESAANTNADQK